MIGFFSNFFSLPGPGVDKVYIGSWSPPFHRQKSSTTFNRPNRTKACWEWKLILRRRYSRHNPLHAFTDQDPNAMKHAPKHHRFSFCSMDGNLLVCKHRCMCMSSTYERLLTCAIISSSTYWSKVFSVKISMFQITRYVGCCGITRMASR